MPKEYPESPTPSPDAFKDQTERGHLSQAAILLSIGNQVRGDAGALRARAHAAGLVKSSVVIPRRDAEALRLPELRPGRKRITLDQLSERYGVTRAPKAELIDSIPQIAKDYHAKPDLIRAAALLEASLNHPAPIVRVAAAASYFEICSEPKKCLQVLWNEVDNHDELTREVAATSLARIDPKHDGLIKLVGKGARAAAAHQANTSMLVHGTWAVQEKWWQPGGDFHTYIKNDVRNDLYANRDRFEWTGGYSDAARALAAEGLKEWVSIHHEDNIDLFCHSHGGNVAMLATQIGVNLGEIVLLSCPAHESQYKPDFSRLKKVVSIRVHMDLVILADRGGQRFTEPRIRKNEHILPVWFNHSATHDPDIWRKYDVKTWL